MKTYRTITCAAIVTAAVCAGLAATLAAQAPVAQAPKKPSIAGNYILESRQLPDGKTVRSPEVMGMLTLTADRRNLNVYWQEDGKPASVHAISTYTLSDKEFTEDNVFYLANFDGNGASYDTQPSTGKAPVTIKGDAISMKLPLHNEPDVVFTPTGMTATVQGEFVDHWKKID
jgi:hypothetical protein